MTKGWSDYKSTDVTIKKDNLEKLAT